MVAGPTQRICHAVNSGRLDHLIDGFLVMNAVVVGIQSYPELIGTSSKEDPHVSDGYIDTPWEIAESVFTVIYCIEMVLKVSVLGWRRYIDNRRNFFDATITMLTVAATLYVYYPNAFSDSRLIRYVVMARVLRLFRLVIAIKDFQVIGNTMLGILPSVKRIFLLLFSLMYTFAIIGVHLYGGLITRDPDNPVAMRLQDTNFADNDYWANSFNDVPSALNVLFNLLVINNWPEQSSGVIAATQSLWTRYYFLLFHICGVVIVSNLLVATLIDSFMDEWQKKQHQNNNNSTTDDSDNTHEAADAEFTQGNEALFEASEVTGTKTTLSGRYVAKISNKSGHTTEERRHNLHKLFTKTSSDIISDSLRLSNSHDSSK
jgi:two pore calcium channel protein